MNIKIIFLLLFCALRVSAQNLFDQENTKKYVDYLMVSGQYKLAIPELERLNFMDTTDAGLKMKLLRSYRLDNKSKLGFEKLKYLYPNHEAIDSLGAIEISKLHMDLQKWDEGTQFWTNSPKIQAKDALIFEANKYVFTQKLKKAQELLMAGQESENRNAYLEVLGKKPARRSPFLSGLLSTVLPGSGRFYAKDWKDGLVSFIFTGSMALQAYRNFNKHGIRDHRGWIYGTVATGFYIGNIYGSVKSANNYNLKEINKVQHEISAIFNARY